MSLFQRLRAADIKDEKSLKSAISQELERANFELQINEIKSNHKLEINEIKAAHEIQVRDLEAKLANQEPAIVKEFKDKAVDLEKKLAVAEARIEMLEKLLDIDSDIVDVKTLVSSLIEKLPNINVSSLSLSVPNKE